MVRGPVAGVQEDTKAANQNSAAPAEPESWDHLTVGGGVVPEGAKRIMREETGQVLFEGTVAVPLIDYETAVVAVREAEVEPQLWLIKDIEREHLTIKNWASTKTPEDAERQRLFQAPSVSVCSDFPTGVPLMDGISGADHGPS